MLNVPSGKHPLVDGGGDRPCVLVSLARFHLIHEFGENICSFIWSHLLYRRYKLIDHLL